MNTLKKFDVYIVGGYVRDRLLNRECKDHDYVVIGATPKNMLDSGFKQVGADFPVFLSPSTGDEFALARTERKVGPGYHGFETDFSPTITLEEDLKRRDITINAMARKVIGWNDLGHAKLSDEIIDPFGGQRDLNQRIIRHTSEAFQDDPVRVLRVARFAARYGFCIAVETLELIKRMVNNGELDHLTPERIWLETEKALSEANPPVFFSVLEKVGALDLLLSECQCINNHALCEGSSASSAERFAILMAQTSQENINSLCDRLKIPNDARTLALRINDVWEDMFDSLDAKQVINIVERLNLIQDENMIPSFNRVMVSFNNFKLLTNVDLIIRSGKAAKKISFEDLTDEQQSSLKGAKIGTAIRDLRVEMVKSFLS